MKVTLRHVLVFVSLIGLDAPALVAQWTTPTPAELSMTSIPEVPGAPAVYLYREQVTDDHLHSYSYYVRLKVLGEGGKDFANVELPFATATGSYATIDNISGRTVEPDGSIVPFTGKPYDKLIAREGSASYHARVFTLPAVQVGSILEYRYKFRFDQSAFYAPEWQVQTPLFVRKAHFAWRPTGKTLIDSSGNVNDASPSWWPVLPAGFSVKQTQRPEASASAESDEGRTELTLDVHDIPPTPREDYMPPMNSLSYRVLFYYTSYKNAGEFWKAEGKTWTRDRDKFIGPGKAVMEEAATLVSPGDTVEQKLKKLYTFVLTLENTDFTRERAAGEDKALGLKEAVTTDDILTRKRGTGDQITELFVALARAAGVKAYLMGVVDHSRRIFLPNYLSIRQLDDYIAIAEIDGKERFFDPGARFATFGQLTWKHTSSGGLRQTATGTDLISSPGGRYSNTRIVRNADLTLDASGMATGFIELSYTGDAALPWRQAALRGDDRSLNQQLRELLEHILPGGIEVRVTNTKNLNDADKPMVIDYEIRGALGNATGKRLLLPASLFEGATKPRFPSASRVNPVDMHYVSTVRDAVRYKFPETFTVESAPAADKQQYQAFAAYTTDVKSAAGSITLSRTMTLAEALFLPREYTELRGFYTKVEGDDAQQVVLLRAAPDTASANPKSRESLAHVIFAIPVASLIFCLPLAAQTSKWTTPTAAELSMTSIPQVPGAPAVMLYKESVSNDSKSIQYYYRIKILTKQARSMPTLNFPVRSNPSTRVMAPSKVERLSRTVL